MDQEQVKQLIMLLQQVLESQIEPKSEKKPAVDPPETTHTIKTRTRRKVSDKTDNKNTNKNSSNKFESMSEFALHREDSAVDKKLSKIPPVARQRDFDFVDVKCRVCGKTETVAPSLVFDTPSRYKCNNCSTQSG